MNSENLSNDTLLSILSLIDKIEYRLKKLETKTIEQLDIMYRPPNEKEHKKLDVVLNDLHNRLNNLEDTSNNI